MSLGISLGVDESRGLVQQVPFWVLGQSFGVPATVDLNFATGQYYQTGTNATDPTTYISTIRNTSALAADASGNWTSFAANAPRITSAGLTVEGASTNFVLQSAAFASGWAPNGTDTLTTGKADPAGGTTAAMMVPSTQNAGHSIHSMAAITLTAAVYTWSAFFKPAGDNFAAVVAISASFGTRFVAVVNLQNGVVTSTSTAGSPSNTSFVVTPYANGWTRLQLQMTADASAGSQISFTAVNAAVPSYDASANPSFAGDGTSGVLVWQPQIELGSFATTPIPTTTAAVTRAADIVTLSTTPSIGASYSLFAAGSAEAPNSVATGQNILSLNDGTVSNRANLVRSSGVGQAVLAGGTGGTINATGTWSQNVPNKVAASFAAGAQAVSLGGSTAATGTAATLPSGLNTLTIGNRADAAAFGNSVIPRITLWPTTALSSTQLQTITSLP